NNEITAAILNPILVAMVEQANDKMGELDDLDTGDKSNLVAAINEVKNGATGFDIHEGPNDPNVTPPGTFGIGDWYIRSGNSIYQYNGSSWILLTANTGNTIV